MSPDKQIAKSVDPKDIVVTACITDSKSKECIVGLIEKYAKVYKLPSDLAISIADCESDFKPDAYGDKGKAYGIYQFHKPTFELFSKKFYEKFGDEDKLDYFNTEDNIKLAIWSIANDRGFHWSCYRKIASK